MQDIIDEMKSLRVVYIENTPKPIYTTLTAFQKDILRLFDFSLNSSYV